MRRAQAERAEKRNRIRLKRRRRKGALPACGVFLLCTPPMERAGVFGARRERCGRRKKALDKIDTA